MDVKGPVDGVDRNRVAGCAVPLEGEQSAADRGHRRGRPDRIPVAATGVGDG